MAGAAAGVVGVVGVGRMGGGIARSLARAGHAVAVRDVVPEAAAALADVATVCASPADVATRAGVVFVVVLDADQVEEVVFGAGGLAAAARPDLVVAVVSTVEVRVVTGLAARAADAGFVLVDAGVTGGVGAAASGSLVTLVGADDPTFATVGPVAEGFSSLVLHMGPVGAGMAAKLARNVISYGAFRAAYEAGRIAEGAGLDVAKLVQAVQHSEGQFGGSAAQLAARGTVGPLAGADPETLASARHLAMLAHKDLRAAAALAADLGVDVPLVTLTDECSDEVFGL